MQLLAHLVRRWILFRLSLVACLVLIGTVYAADDDKPDDDTAARVALYCEVLSELEHPADHRLEACQRILACKKLAAMKNKQATRSAVPLLVKMLCEAHPVRLNEPGTDTIQDSNGVAGQMKTVQLTVFYDDFAASRAAYDALNAIKPEPREITPLLVQRLEGEHELGGTQFTVGLMKYIATFGPEAKAAAPVLDAILHRRPVKKNAGDDADDEPLGNRRIAEDPVGREVLGEVRDAVRAGSSVPRPIPIFDEPSTRILAARTLAVVQADEAVLREALKPLLRMAEFDRNPAVRQEAQQAMDAIKQTLRGEPPRPEDPLISTPPPAAAPAQPPGSPYIPPTQSVGRP